MGWRLVAPTPTLLPHSYPEEVLEAVQEGMGMTNSSKVALEEGANIIRIGTKIFGERVGSS